jgi:predicted alpha/beta-hydrolase family hydrolase
MGDSATVPAAVVGNSAARSAVMRNSATMASAVVGDSAVMAATAMGASAMMDATVVSAAATVMTTTAAAVSSRFGTRLKRQERRSHHRQSKGPGESVVKEFHDSIWVYFRNGGCEFAHRCLLLIRISPTL